MATFPPHQNKFVDHGAQPSLIKCKKCEFSPDHYQAIEIENSSFITFNCTSGGCKGGTWFICSPCSRSFPRYNKAEAHAKTERHKRNCLEVQSQVLSQQKATPTVDTPSSVDKAFDDSQSKFYPLPNHGESQDQTILFDDDDPNNSLFLTPNDDVYEDRSTTVLPPTDARVTDAANPTTLSVNASPERTHNMLPLGQEHVWLADLLKDTPKATGSEVFDSLQCSPNMQRFFQAEHNSFGGGLVYLVGRAFNRTSFVGPEHLPDFREAKWQVQNFMQYIGMSERQRSWHAQITMAVTSGANDLINKTRIPNAKELKRFYKSDCQHCLWEALPIPHIQNIGGIAYVNPVDIIRFVFAMGLELDDIPVTRETKTDLPGGKQFYVADSKKVRDLVKALKAAQDENGDYRLAMVWCTDWRDGFGTNRTKNNRKSVVAWTFSVSPGKAVVNSVGNTFAMALGQKKNKAWPEVEHKVRMDTSVFGDPNKPLQVYHGRLRKMVSVFVARINTSHDKPERADVTGTLSFGSNTHRSFGRLVHIQTPPCDSEKVEEFLAAANPSPPNHLSNRLEWGWTDKMLDQGALGRNGMPNGANLPACLFCRAKNLHRLLGKFPNANSNITHNELIQNFGECVNCANWTMDKTTASKLPFKIPEDYPTTCNPNCPVEPPTGRCTTNETLQVVTCPETGKEENYLQLLQLEFPNMVKACKFAFFHLVSDKPWTKGTTKAYLTANGIAPKHANELWSIANDAKREGRIVDYNDPERIDRFRFPAAWIDPNLDVKDYIETVMHEVALGVTESNFELCSLWNRKKGRDTNFRKSAQDLLLELKKFGLNWLHTYPFSTSDEGDNPSGNYGTGAWAGENWIAWIRISKIVYLQVLLPHTTNQPKTAGNGDVIRLVVAFSALAARALSHSGIDQSDIEEFDVYLKEFLSCVKELDIQTRHSDMKKKKKVVDAAAEAPGSDPTQVEDAINLSVLGGKQSGKIGNDSLRNDEDRAKRKSETTGKKGGNKRTRSASSVMAAKPANKKKRKGKGGTIGEDDDDSDYCDTDEKKTTPSKAKKSSNSSTKRSTKIPNKAKSKSKKIGTKTKKATKRAVFTGGAEAFWTKSNYLSLPNLTTMMEVFGLLINFWDGGGKGEKFVQEVKPLISRGVPDYASFFVIIMEKLYKHRLLDIFREMYGLFSVTSKDAEVPTALPQYSIGLDGEIAPVDNDIEVAEELPSCLPGQDYSPMEDFHMAKHKTFFSYRSYQHLDDAITNKKPISGILVHHEKNSTQMDFYALYKVYNQKKLTYGWKKIRFDDSNGVRMGGLWYAPMETVEATQEVPENLEGIQQIAKMSTVAIPMAYGIGLDKPDSDKFCVITNWWKERQSNGRYSMPGLDPEWYVRSDNYDALLEQFQNPNAV